jgi:hypothetical protein
LGHLQCIIPVHESVYEIPTARWMVANEHA